MSLILTRNKFAKLVGFSPSTVTRWLKAGMPAKRSARQGAEVEIDLAAALPWALKYVSSEAGPEPGSQRERLAKAQAERVEMANLEKRQYLIPADYHSEVLASLASETAQQLEALPGRVAGEIAGLNDPATVRARLLDECRKIRAALASHIRELPDRLDQLDAEQAGQR